MPETETVKPAPTVYDMIRAGVESGDRNFHRRMDPYFLKKNVAGASDFATVTEEEWIRYAEMVKRAVTDAKEKKIQAAMEVLEGAVNGDDKDLVIAAMCKVHAYLFNELINAAMATVKQRMTDGRISGIYKEMVEKYF